MKGHKEEWLDTTVRVQCLIHLLILSRWCVKRKNETTAFRNEAEVTVRLQKVVPEGPGKGFREKDEMESDCSGVAQWE